MRLLKDMKEDIIMRRSSDNSVVIISEETAKKYFDKKDRKPIENEHLIIQKAREHLRKHGLSI